MSNSALILALSKIDDGRWAARNRRGRGQGPELYGPRQASRAARDGGNPNERCRYHLCPRWHGDTRASLDQRRSTGRLCFNRYQTSITIPERIGDFPTLGSTVVFETSVDAYAEVWVDAELTRAGPARWFGDRGLEHVEPAGHRARCQARAEDPACDFRPMARSPIRLPISSGCGWRGSNSKGVHFSLPKGRLGAGQRLPHLQRPQRQYPIHIHERRQLSLSASRAVILAPISPGTASPARMA